MSRTIPELPSEHEDAMFKAAFELARLILDESGRKTALLASSIYDAALRLHATGEYLPLEAQKVRGKVQ